MVNMKKLSVFGILLLVTVSIFCQTYEFENRRYVYDTVTSFLFKDRLFHYNNSDYTHTPVPNSVFPVPLTGPYKIKNVANFTVAEVDFPEGKRDIYVFYEGRHIILYDTLRKEVFYGTDRVYDEPFIYPIRNVEATSYFTEILKGKEVKYTPDNLTNSDITKPWVEGVEGNGIGEKLRIGRYDSGRGIRHLLIINGFFSPTQPELYLDNGRIKKVMMRGYNADGELIYEGVHELKDTPNLQLLSSVVPVSEFELEILEVYPGRRFEDTAVSGIFHDGMRYLLEMDPRG
jgi:hypothetical protein